MKPNLKTLRKEINNGILAGLDELDKLEEELQQLKQKGLYESTIAHEERKRIIDEILGENQHYPIKKTTPIFRDAGEN